MNFFKHHIGDYDSATAHLSWDEDMAYTRLMRVYYRDERPIPLEARQIYRLVRAQSKAQCQAVDVVLKEFFRQGEDGWRNKRCDEEVAQAQAQARVNRRIATNRPRKANGSSNESNRESSHETSNESYNGASTNGPPLQTPDSNIQTPISKSHTHSEGVGGWKRPKTVAELEAEEASRANQ